jgi:hypothetical protein
MLLLARSRQATDLQDMILSWFGGLGGAMMEGLDRVARFLGHKFRPYFNIYLGQTHYGLLSLQSYERVPKASGHREQVSINIMNHQPFKNTWEDP